MCNLLLCVRSTVLSVTTLLGLGTKNHLIDPLQPTSAYLWAQGCPFCVAEPYLLVFLDCQDIVPPVKRSYKHGASSSRFFLGVLHRYNFSM